MVGFQCVQYEDQPVGSEGIFFIQDGGFLYPVDLLNLVFENNVRNCQASALVGEELCTPSHQTSQVNKV